ncbi:MAG: OmpA family protein [Thermoguttaceae bacterium]|nr:OmpA family protein [Thermoguttaceae bacterium]MDW8037271.1 flagellar motor protein MotB [Thermoguttaceae bacterium]
MPLPPEEPPKGAPEWVVTYGDMMSLLLCFFILLASMSEIRNKEQFQMILEALRRQFGYERSKTSVIPGSVRPLNTTMKLAILAATGRARRLDTMNGGDRIRAPVGDFARVQSIRRTGDRTLGGRIRFEEASAQIDSDNFQRLEEIARFLQGKPQKIEIRGHTSSRPLPADSPFKDHWQLAYERCIQTKEVLVRLGINPKRLVLTVVADNEPIEKGEDPLKLQENSRVEIHLLNELADLGDTKP